MSNTSISEIYESFSEDDTNRYLADGWVIVAVVAGTRLSQGSQEVGPVYVLGKPKRLPEQLGPRHDEPRR